MNLAQRQIVHALLGVLVVGTVILSISELFGNRNLTVLISTLVASVLLGVLWYAYWRGWEPARYVLVGMITAVLVPSLPMRYVFEDVTLSIFLPPLVALIATSPPWVLGSAALVYGGLLVRAQGQGAYADPQTAVLFVMIIGGMALSRIVTDRSQRIAETNASRAEEALARSEAQARELATKADELATQNDQQRRLLDLVATLETPAVALAEGVLLAPVVGHLDSRRAQALTSRLLSEVGAQRARLVVLDIAGVSTVDTEVAQALVRAVQALRLLGCAVTITGISAAVAATMTTLGINMRGIDTARTPQEALEQAVVVKSPRREPLTNGPHHN